MIKALFIISLYYGPFFLNDLSPLKAASHQPVRKSVGPACGCGAICMAACTICHRLLLLVQLGLELRVLCKFGFSVEGLLKPGLGIRVFVYSRVPGLGLLFKIGFRV